MLFKQNITHRPLFWLTLAAFFLAVVVVVLGAFTRLVDAGLGCPDWPGCYGHVLWPDEPHEIIEAEKSFPDTPVDISKTWPEMVHRYFAGVLGLVILMIAVVSSLVAYKTRALRLKQPSDGIPVKLPLLLLGLVVFQAVLGMWTVTLKLWPQVVTAHLLGGFCTLSLLWLLNQRLGGERWLLSSDQYQRLQQAKPLLTVAFVVVTVQIILGGWVSSNYAALACPDVPLCLGQWLPPMDVLTGFTVFQTVGPNYLGGQLDNESRTAIHFVHRVGAIVVLIMLMALGAYLWRTGASAVKKWVVLLWLVVSLQIALGIGNILWALPIATAVAHNATGALLLLVMVSIAYRCCSATRVSRCEIEDGNGAQSERPSR